MKAIFPFVLFFFLFTIVVAWLAKIRVIVQPKSTQTYKKQAYPYLFLFLLVILTILKILPLYIAFLVFFYALILDTSSLRIDFFLLGTFYLFFGIADNCTHIFAQQLHHPHTIFLLGIALSQIMSNVPATVFLANFTDNWQALLWGVSVGGYGILWGSLANIIAYKFYIKKFDNSFSFLLKFLAYNFLALFLGIALFYIVRIYLF